MEETEKPFGCKIDNCTMTFTNEDHLSVHQKKHDMSLNIGSASNKSGFFTADQTPTPTRLIRNCDEVGLFDDLQHVNPFDETFRRAVESDRGDALESNCVKPILTTQSTLEALTMHNEETLHTPNVMPYSDSVNCIKNLKMTISLDDDLLQPIGSSASSSSAEIMQTVNIQPPTPIEIHTVKKEEDSAQTVIVKATEAKPILVFSTYPTPMTSRPIAKPLKKLYPKKLPVADHPIKDKLKQMILRAKEAAKPPVSVGQETKVIMKREPNARDVGTKTKTHFSNNSSNSSSNGTTNGPNNELFERNRATAQRYRIKKKKNQDLLHQRNTELEMENERLRNELKGMRSLLLAHQDCSVTRALVAAAQTQCSTAATKTSIVYLMDANVKAKIQKSSKS